MTATTLTVATLTDAIRTVLTKDGDLTGKPAAKDVLAVLGMKGSPEFYAMWGEVKETAVPWQEKAAWVLSTWKGQDRIPGRACRAAEAAIAAGATTATAMKAPKGVDAIEHRLRVLRDLLGDKAPATVVAEGPAPAPVTPPATAPVQQQSAAQSQTPTAAQEPAAAKPDAKAIQAEVDQLGQEEAALRRKAAAWLDYAVNCEATVSQLSQAGSRARKGDVECRAAADALQSKRAAALALLATLVNIPVPPAPAKPEPLSQSDNVLTCEPKVQPPVVVPPSVPVVNANLTAPIGQKDAMRLGKDGLLKVARQLMEAGKLTGPIDTSSKGWMAKLASRVAKATEKPAADKSAATQAKPAALRLYVEDGKGGFRLASEQEIWAALDQMSKAAA